MNNGKHGGKRASFASANQMRTQDSATAETAKSEGLERLMDALGGGSGLLGLLDQGGGLPEHVIDNARGLETLAKAAGAVTQQNERALRVQTEAARLVDMQDVELLLDGIFAEHIDIARTLPTQMSAEVQTLITAGKSPQEILTEVTKYLFAEYERAAQALEQRLRQFEIEQRHKQTAKRGGGRKRVSV